MTGPNLVNGLPSPTHDQEHPPLSQPNTNPISFEKVDSSVAKLIRNWNRRKRWRLVFNNYDTATAEPAQSSDGSTPWRTALVGFLESNPLHIITILLLVSDIVLVILELSSSFPNSGCTERRNKGEDIWFHWVGISILFILLAKSIGLILGLGISFFTRPGYVVDTSVLFVAIFLEIFLERKGGGLLVVVSLWRVIRLIESAFELSDDAIEAQIKKIVSELESLRENGRGMGDF